jgi:SAM-dependent methyltransferase
MNMKIPPSDWYMNIWSLDIKDQSWVEQTPKQVDFIINVLELTGKERILDLACGYGRHSLELARRGYNVVGVDITPSYIEYGTQMSKNEKLDIEFICSDIRGIEYQSDFDVVLNLADGAIGYLENDCENLKIFKAIAKSLRPGGKSLIDICNQAHAIMHFPKKHWEIGSKQISLPAFDYDASTKRMLYGGFGIELGEIARLPQSIEAHSSTRLYSFEEVTEIFSKLGVETVTGYGDYDLNTPIHHKNLQMLIISVKK